MAKVKNDFWQIIQPTIAPLLGLAIFTLGNGLLSTYVVVRMHLEGYPDYIIGYMSTSFFAGLVIGSFQIEKFIVKVGHIRVYATFASAVSVMALLHSIFLNEWLWILVRFISGFSTAGIFIVVESWLLLTGTSKNRGVILSVYMVVYYAAQSFSQLLINVADPKSHFLFSLVAILFSLSTIPIASSKIKNPVFEIQSSLKLKELLSLSFSGLAGSFGSGLLLGALYGLMPLYFSKLYTSTEQVSYMMFTVIMGGMALQYPLGKLSDILDRRYVLIFMSLVTIISCFFILQYADDLVQTFIWIFLFGGMSFTIYPVAISLACDNLSSDDMVAGTQGMLFTNAFGAMLGPFFGGYFMEFFEINGLVYFYILVSSIMLAYFLYRLTVSDKKPHEDNFQAMPQPTSPIVSELDPRSE